MGRSLDATQADLVDGTDDDEEEDDPSYLTVELGPKARTVPGKPDGSKIFHEFDEGHPGGEALVVLGRRVRVKQTARVREAIAAGLLTISKKPATKRPPDVSEILDESRREFAERERAAAGAASVALTTDGGEGGEEGGDTDAPPTATKPRTTKKP